MFTLSSVGAVPASFFLRLACVHGSWSVPSLAFLAQANIRQISIHVFDSCDEKEGGGTNRVDKAAALPVRKAPWFTVVWEPDADPAKVRRQAGWLAGRAGQGR